MPRMKRLLIANRGECALRIHRTCEKLGIESIGIVTQEDEHSLHCKAISSCFKVSSYTSIEDIIEVALKAKADAIHPGYGFLSENPSFAEAVIKGGLIWVGPSPEVIETFGLKDRARALAIKIGIPVSEGSPLLKDYKDVRAWAEKVGYPVILKPTGGGGGIGMKVIHTEKELSDPSVFQKTQDLAAKFFGAEGSSLFLERYVPNGRHIEIQVFGDGMGKVIHLGDRECSTQRRNQKIVEETPSHGISEETRAALCDAAVRLCAHVRYESAGTVEFMYDEQRKNWFFLEVNTRLQVEHGVTEMVNGDVDIVEWMIMQAKGFTPCNNFVWNPKGHAIQIRLYAEDCLHEHRPSAGVLQEFKAPVDEKSENGLHAGDNLRFETWCYRGCEVSANYDPLLAKVLQWGPTRYECIRKLKHVLDDTTIQGINSNLSALRQYVVSPEFLKAQTLCHTFDEFLSKGFRATCFEVVKAGMNMTVQDWPGREGRGLWRIGVPPSGAFDHLTCRFSNRLVGNTEDLAVLEFLSSVSSLPSLRFYDDMVVACCAPDHIELKIKNISGEIVRPVPLFASFKVRKGDILEVTKPKVITSLGGSRGYLAFRGGIDVPLYLGSRATFINGNFGGHKGRALKVGDLLPVAHSLSSETFSPQVLPKRLRPQYEERDWEIGVLPGPRANPDFMTNDDIKMLHATKWKVHHNSNRLGIRLIGPKPTWTRPNGGEGGSHPSNIHDEEYAVGTINFTGDMPIIITHDGPSLGGFVCPICIVQSEIWKTGQVKAGDTIQFKLTTVQDALWARMRQNWLIENLTAPSACISDLLPSDDFGVHQDVAITTKAILFERESSKVHPGMAIRLQGDRYVLVEYGEMKLDIRLRVRVHFLEQGLWDLHLESGLDETAPGVRSLQIRYNNLQLPLTRLLEMVRYVDDQIGDISSKSVMTRVFKLPMAFDSKGCTAAMEKYSKSIRDDAPYLPNNVVYVGQNNGFDDPNEVRKRVFRASYMCLGLGDVYLGACCAVPVNPLNRLITTKMNPARTWTEEGTVGLGGAYMCIYPMYSPGGYQLVGRTLPIWNTYGLNQPRVFSREKPWMLEMFDQIRFYEVPEDELDSLRLAFRNGKFTPELTTEEFKLEEYSRFLESIKDKVSVYQAQQRKAMAEMNELDRQSQLRIAVRNKTDNIQAEVKEAAEEDEVCGEFVLAEVTANVWEVRVKVGAEVKKGDTVVVLEAMKLEISVASPCTGTIVGVRCKEGLLVDQGDILLVVAPKDRNLKRPESKQATGQEQSKLNSKKRHSLQINQLLEAYKNRSVTVSEIVNQIYDDIEARDREYGEKNFGNVWIQLGEKEDVIQYVNEQFVSDTRFSPERSPLYGIPFVVKDNFDVQGWNTTAGCPGYSYLSNSTATCVSKLLEAGAVLIGKTNMDQFATGLVGTRSPYGACANSFDPEYISGGSSSGSAVAVSLGFATFSLGTDTAGSGRVPASLNNIVGLKPSRGMISTEGVIPACRSLDCVSIFALTCIDAQYCLNVMRGYDAADPYSRGDQGGMSKVEVSKQALSTASFKMTKFRFATPKRSQLRFFKNKTNGLSAFEESVALLESVGGQRVEVDFTPWNACAELLYGGPWVAERLAGLESVMNSKVEVEGLNDVTRGIIKGADKYSAIDTFRAMYRLEELRKETTRKLFGGGSENVDILVTPTVGPCYKILEVEVDPVQSNSNNGYYTNFMNLLDMCGLAIPTTFCAMEDGVKMPFGVTISAPAFNDELLISIGNLVQLGSKLSLGQIGELINGKERQFKE